MKITIEHENQKCTLEDETVVDIYDVAQLLRQAVMSIGFDQHNVNAILPEE